MGMAASQARLLTLTSRLHDVEYKAQNLMSQKIALATQKDELYQDYCDALDATKIQVRFNDGASTKYVDANFSTLFGYNENRMSQYTLTDSKTGKVIVDDFTAKMYEGYGNDKYCFAYAMIGMDDNFSWDEDKDGMFVGISTSYSDEEQPDLYMTECEEIVFNEHQDDDKLTAAYEDLENAETSADKREALQTFRDLLYDSYANEIYEYMKYNKKDDKENVIAADELDYTTTWDEVKNEFNYYLNLWEQINASGGCQVIEPQCESGKAGNEWFNQMVDAGRVIISVYNTNKKEWVETSVATSTNENNLQEVQDETDLKKAEAEYEHELDKINAKDTKYDQDLSKLETERTSITTEIDSIKQVRDDNIERTFGIFS